MYFFCTLKYFSYLAQNSSTMDPLTLGAVTAGAAGITQATGGLLSGKKNRKAAARENQKQRDFAQQQADQAYAYDLEQWHRNNAYNDPSAQMTRLQNAGLNPNLVYGNGAVGNASGASPSYHPASYNHKESRQSESAAILEGLSTVGPMLAQLQNTFAQNDLLKAQARNVQAQTDKTRADTNRSVFDLSFLESTRPFNYTISQNRSVQSFYDSDSSFHRSQILENDAVISKEVLPQAIELIKTQAENAVRQGRLLDQNLLTEIQNTLSRTLENELTQLGLRSGDALPLRVIGRAIRSLFPNFHF